MASYGLLPTGFVPKVQDTILDEVTGEIRELRGPEFDMSGGSLVGQWAGVLSEREAAIWSLMAALDAAQDPDRATGAALDAICTLTGTFRLRARASSVMVTLTGNNGTSIPAGTLIKTSGGNLFATAESVSLTPGTSWFGSNAWNVGDQVDNGGSSYECITAGTGASSGGPSGSTPGLPIVDGAAEWVFLGEGTSRASVLALSTLQDAVVAVAYDLNVRQTPVSGWRGVMNTVSATLGNREQADESLRVTRENELAGQGTGPGDAIRAAILRAGVTSCNVLINDGDTVDGNGQDPHSVQAVVEGGTDAAIAAALKAQVGAGIKTVGTTAVVINDSQGTPRTYRFTRVTEVPIYVVATYTYNPAAPNRGGYAPTGDQLAKASIVAAGNARGVGRDATASAISASLFPVFVNSQLAAGVQGILDVSSIKIGTTPAPITSATIVISLFQRATFALGNVTINSSPGTV